MRKKEKNEKEEATAQGIKRGWSLMNGILSRIGSLPLRVAKKLPTDDLHLIIVLCRANSRIT